MQALVVWTQHTAMKYTNHSECSVFDEDSSSVPLACNIMMSCKVEIFN